MWWDLPVFAFVDTSVLSCWNSSAVPAIRAFAHERSIGADRSGFKRYWDPTARRLSPLPVSRNSISLSFLSWFNWTVPKTWNGALALFALSFAVAKKKVGENGIGARSLPPEHFASTLFHSHDCWRLSVQAGFDPRSQQLRMPRHFRPTTREWHGRIRQTGHDHVDHFVSLVTPLFLCLPRPHFLFLLFI